MSSNGHSSPKPKDRKVCRTFRERAVEVFSPIQEGPDVSSVRERGRGEDIDIYVTRRHVEREEKPKVDFRNRAELAPMF